MTEKAWGNAYRATTVCIDSYEKGVLAGRLFNPYFDTGQAFESLTQFLFLMEKALDAMQFPQSTHAMRTFAGSSGLWPERPETDFRQGRAATFVAKVLFRQNASWQGSVQWMEGQREQSFRSALELIFLLDNALRSATEKAG